MDFELALASKRLEKEAAKRKAAESARLERQRAEKDRVEAKRLELEAHLAAERRAAADAAARLRDRHDILLEKNKGLWACQTLVPTLNRSAESAGIRRRADKISLPRSFGAALTGQHSHAHHGHMFFELSVGNGLLTHAALLDFEAPEGTVGLPPKVLRCLGLDGALSAGEDAGAPASEPAAVIARGAPAGAPPPMVTVAYRGLQAGTYAKLQPTSASFQRELGDIKLALELELQTHCTLSGKAHRAAPTHARSHASTRARCTARTLQLIRAAHAGASRVPRAACARSCVHAVPSDDGSRAHRANPFPHPTCPPIARRLACSPTRLTT
jgi:hypothetical protein